MNYTNHFSRPRLRADQTNPTQGLPTFLKLAAATLALACVLGQTATAQQIAIQPTTEATSKDTKIYNSVPTSNFSSNLNITSSDVGAYFLSLVQFDLSTVSASPANVTSASLTLFCTGIGASGVVPAIGGTVTLQPILNAWREEAADTTPAGAPLATYSAFFGTPATLTLGNVVSSQNVTAGGYITWDLTSTVKSWLAGSLANNGVLIALSTSGGDIGFADVDSNGAANAPKLTVNVVPEPSSVILSITGLALLGAVLRHRRAMA